MIHHLEYSISRGEVGERFRSGEFLITLEFKISKVHCIQMFKKKTLKGGRQIESGRLYKKEVNIEKKSAINLKCKMYQFAYIRPDFLAIN